MSYQCSNNQTATATITYTSCNHGNIAIKDCNGNTIVSNLPF